MLSNLLNSIPAAASGLNGIVVGAAAEIAKSRNRTSPQQAKMQFPTTEKPAYGMYFRFNKLTYDLMPGSKAQFSNLTDGAHIFLPLPGSGLREQLGINYNSQEVGAIGAAMATGAMAGGVVSDTFSGASNDAQRIIATNEVAVRAGGSAALALRSSVNNFVPGAGAILDMKTGNVVNPYALALFQSVAPRAHNLTWRLFPRSQSDSIAIRQIINQFKFHALPTRTESGLFLKMPSEVEMAFYGTDKLFKFAPCVINGVTVNYTPMNAPSFFGEDNAPNGVELTVDFQEIESLTRESYAQEGVTDAFGAGPSSLGKAINGLGGGDE